MTPHASFVQNYFRKAKPENNGFNVKRVHAGLIGYVPAMIESVFKYLCDECIDDKYVEVFFLYQFKY